MEIKQTSILEQTLKELELQTAGSDYNVSLEEIPFQGQFVIRSLDTLKDLNAALEPVTGIKMTNKPNTTETGKKGKIFWLREGQWLFVTPAKTSAAIGEKLIAAVADLDSSVVDNSSGYTMLRISGEKARDTIKKGCPLDIYPKVFGPGSMALTRIMHADVLLHHPEDKLYDLYIRKSFAEYLLRFVHDAALEFGVEVKK